MNVPVKDPSAFKNYYVSLDKMNHKNKKGEQSWRLFIASEKQMKGRSFNHKVHEIGTIHYVTKVLRQWIEEVDKKAEAKRKRAFERQVEKNLLKEWNHPYKKGDIFQIGTSWYDDYTQEMTGNYTFYVVAGTTKRTLKLLELDEVENRIPVLNAEKVRGTVKVKMHRRRYGPEKGKSDISHHVIIKGQYAQKVDIPETETA